ncbi:MarR family winged helix-turn-helix transcriptional regulator [Roseburia sp.]|uniref:MarR family winged helix-turn-helix transcriptional regulator n=1 Tax=Roseburia sp. TaxID=2049040 RepID=UPI003522345F
MFPSELLTANKKIMHVYESFCTPLCRKYQLNQSDLDLILFIANNPMYNTAKDVCEIRGIKKGIVSVTTERLVQSGYLIRKNDIHDRRIQRLCLTEKCQPIIADGQRDADAFFHLCHLPD